MKIDRMFRNKKGVELSMNTIIVAAIALIVLIVLVLILTGNAGKLSVGIKDCAGKGGVSAADIKTCADKGGVVIDSTFYEKDKTSGNLITPEATDKRVCCSK